jgi:hypothetical protein
LPKVVKRSAAGLALFATARWIWQSTRPTTPNATPASERESSKSEQ